MNFKEVFIEKPISRLIRYTFLFSIVIGGSTIFTYYYAVSEYGYGGLGLLFLHAMFVLPIILLPFLLIPFSIIGLIIRKFRKASLRFLIIGVIVITTGLPSICIGLSIRMNEFQKLAQRSTPLINAIKNYERKYGVPPQSIEVLIPEFLDKFPKTGMPTYPNYVYKILSSDEASHYAGNPWIISVATTLTMTDFDCFIYLPKQNYPREGYGGSLEKISDWAYVHE
ncbi:MAG: hypothetical protein AAB038_03795 [Planctomycetota bacterium]